jgi:hypothetical protein
MPAVILKPDNFMADREIVNVQTGLELINMTKKIYKIPPVHIEFWTGSVGFSERRRFYPETEAIPENPLTLYVKIVVPIQYLPTVPGERGRGASRV